ncbi:T9SS type A sorting domain-containing protein [Runella zeae]|jgi:endo-beta-N-acetylglucosaminidase D|uniref:T9SS type A sorting domain-containing protein n=1 Tax=Runella zeae TaxID=94255 RepID=UPI000405EFB0|nr:T9SS type A sorting domain-containing protein [Runella zeae]
MKTIIKSIACALALTTSVAFASNVEEKTTDNRPVPTFESSTFVTADANIRVAIKKNAAEKVYILLKSTDGQVIFSETIAKKSMAYAAKINVNDLADGVYQLEISAGKERVVKQLNLASKKIEVERKVTVQ